jgi:Tol biopolymer transport system component
VGETSGALRDTRVAGSVESGRETSLTPVWAPGDTAIVYQRLYETGGKIEVVDLRGGTVRELFAPVARPRQLRIADWSSDGHRIAYVWIGRDSTARWQALEWDARTDSTRRIVDAADHVTDIRYAPRSDWVAYELTASGESDVFVRPSGASGTPVRVSAGGGRSPRWRADGGELYYVTPVGSVAAVSVRYAPALAIGAPQIVVPASALGERQLENFDVSPDGRRFYVETGERVDELTLILDWRALLNKAR